jgi:hypothetical protein
MAAFFANRAVLLIWVDSAIFRFIFCVRFSASWYARCRNSVRVSRHCAAGGEPFES